MLDVAFRNAAIVVVLERYYGGGGFPKGDAAWGMPPGGPGKGPDPAWVSPKTAFGLRFCQLYGRSAQIHVRAGLDMSQKCMKTLRP